ncbi:MAG: zinc-binding dehydrogenase [Candidatus Andersenbacteria bacterium]|nr:zinc-binding dehydrogenase [Candidatus Andersenbacteria bacterium]
MKTQAAILVRPGQPLVVDEIEVPPLERGQVLLQMRAAGVCRTQLGEARGWRGHDPHVPHLLGHEGYAQVLGVGPGVHKVQVGNAVIVSWIKGRGLDAPGPQYRWGRRSVQAGGAAVFAERVVVSENRVTRLRHSLPADAAAVLGCAVATGAGAVRRLLKIRPETRFGVFGIGGVGGSAVLAAAALKCRCLVAIDVSRWKLKWAKKLGATATVLAEPKSGSTAQKVQTKFGGLDAALEAAGIPLVAEEALAALAPHGTLVVAGHPLPGLKMRVDPFELICGKRILGTWGGQTVPERDFNYYAREYKAGRLPVDRLVTHRFSLPEINEALGVVESGEAGRVVIAIDR